MGRVPRVLADSNTNSFDVLSCVAFAWISSCSLSIACPTPPSYALDDAVPRRRPTEPISATLDKIRTSGALQLETWNFWLAAA